MADPVHEVNLKLDLILVKLTLLETLIRNQGRLIMPALDDLAAQVQANTDAEKSAIQLIQGLAAEVAAAASDPAKVQALATQLKASADALGAAIVANTPAAPPAPPPAPAPTP